MDATNMHNAKMSKVTQDLLDLVEDSGNKAAGKVFEVAMLLTSGAPANVVAGNAEAAIEFVSGGAARISTMINSVNTLAEITSSRQGGNESVKTVLAAFENAKNSHTHAVRTLQSIWAMTIFATEAHHMFMSFVDFDDATVLILIISREETPADMQSFISKFIGVENPMPKIMAAIEELNLDCYTQAAIAISDPAMRKTFHDNIMNVTKGKREGSFTAMSGSMQ